MNDKCTRTTTDLLADGRQATAPAVVHSTPEPFCDIDAVATFLSKPKSFVYAHSKELGARKVGQALRFRLSEVEAFVLGQMGDRG